MRYRHVGRAGIQVSELALGSWVTFGTQVDVTAAADMMAAAYDSGINFFDNAQVYAGGKAESVMGAALKNLGWRGGSFLVSTKFFWGLHDAPNEKNTLNVSSVITGASRVEQLRENLKAVDFVERFTPDIMARIDGIFEGSSR